MITFPSKDVLMDRFLETPNFMHPNNQPWFAYEESVVSADLCADIVRFMFAEDEYEFQHCNAHTREAPRPLDPIFKPIDEFLLEANEEFWKYDLRESAAWMQTYFEGNSYQAHMDANIGQTRKLTAVLMLTDPSNYLGGELEFYIPPDRLRIPNTQGTLVVFPHWVIHEVMSVERGMRQTINLGYWGPPFR